LKILITGGTGFVGQNITDALSRTYGENNVIHLGKKDCDLTSSYGLDKITTLVLSFTRRALLVASVTMQTTLAV
jgi:nucleoside-diphosphate-sugar epimerase